MNSYLSSSSLKRIARGQLFGRLGTVIGAFLVHMLCVAPAFAVGFVILTFAGMLSASGNAVGYLTGLLTELLLAFLISMYMAVFFYGEDFLYLKIAGGYDTYVSDLFQGFRENFLKLMGCALAPSVMITLGALPFFVFFNRYIGEYLPHTDEFARLLFENDVTKLNDFVMQFMPVIRPMRYALYLLLFLMLVTGVLFSQTFFLLADFGDLPAAGLYLENNRLMKGNHLRYLYVVMSFSLWFLLSLFSCIFIVAIWVFPYYKATMANFYLDLLKTREEERQSGT